MSDAPRLVLNDVVRRIIGDFEPGSCFEVAYKVATALEVLDHEGALRVLRDLYVCHGIVTGTRGDVAGVRYSHGWVEAKLEIGRVALDFSQGDVVLRRGVYYQAGSIDPDEVVRYTVEEATRLCAERSTWGPWAETVAAL